MSDYIDRKLLKEMFWGACKNCLSEDDIADLIDEVPAADVRPVVRGKWEFIRKTIDGKVFKCSACGRVLIVDDTFDRIEKYPFCNCCGADMRG